VEPPLKWAKTILAVEIILFHFRRGSTLKWNYFQTVYRRRRLESGLKFYKIIFILTWNHADIDSIAKQRGGRWEKGCSQAGVTDVWLTSCHSSFIIDLTTRDARPLRDSVSSRGLARVQIVNSVIERVRRRDAIYHPRCRVASSQAAGPTTRTPVRDVQDSSPGRPMNRETTLVRP